MIIFTNQIIGLQPRADIGHFTHIKIGGNFCALFTLPHHARVGSFTQHEIKRINQYRLARACFAAQDSKAWLKSKFKGVHNNEIADLFGKFKINPDGDTSYEELKCIGLRPQSDLFEVFDATGQLIAGKIKEYITVAKS